MLAAGETTRVASVRARILCAVSARNLKHTFAICGPEVKEFE
jgi:hypothetical protein